MKDRPIGEKFLYDGHVLEVQIESCAPHLAQDTFKRCFFDSDESCRDTKNVGGSCYGRFRPDGRGVVFVDCGTLEELDYTLPIGCKVEIDGTEYVVVRAPYQNSCSGCDLFAGKCRRMDLNQGTCFASLREDGVGVIYKKVEGGQK